MLVNSNNKYHKYLDSLTFPTDDGNRKAQVRKLFLRLLEAILVAEQTRLRLRLKAEDGLKDHGSPTTQSNSNGAQTQVQSAERTNGSINTANGKTNGASAQTPLTNGSKSDLLIATLLRHDAFLASLLACSLEIVVSAYRVDDCEALKCVPSLNFASFRLK